MTPRISIMFPTRGRPDRAFGAIHGAFFRASAPEKIEAVIRCDDDDPMLDVYRQLYIDSPHHESITLLVGPRYRGYLDLNKHWNELGAVVRGDWIWALNDDAIVEVRGWDEMVYAHDADARIPCVLAPHDNSAAPVYYWCAFPIFTRVIIEKTGHATVFSSIDNWMDEVIHHAGVWPFHRLNDLVIDHRRPTKYPETVDQTWLDSETARRAMVSSWELRREDHWKPLIEADRAALGSPEDY